MNGFGSNDSDVDVCLLVKHTELDVRCIAIEHLVEVLKHLKQSGKIYKYCIVFSKIYFNIVMLHIQSFNYANFYFFTISYLFIFQILLNNSKLYMQKYPL